MWLSGESKVAEVGVLTISAPRARRVSTFSALIFSGRTIIQRYPLTAAARASPEMIFFPKIRVKKRFEIPALFSAGKKRGEFSHHEKRVF